MNKRVRVRFAPSPTGGLHLGGVRTVLYNYLFAKQHAGDFILRIEDTDQNRYVEGAEKYIIDCLEWCGLIPDEGPGIGGVYGPYRQSERKILYKEYAEKLVSNGFAYYAFDTPEEIESLRESLKAQGKSNLQYDHFVRMQMRNSLSLTETETKALIDSGVPYVIRIKVLANEVVSFNDMIRGEMHFDTNNVDDKVLLKADGMPTYHLAVVVDDYLMKITHAFRGEEWLPSAAVHVLLWNYLGWIDEMPQWAHLPLILKPDGNGKLSKRDGDMLGFPVFAMNWLDPITGKLVSGFKEQGFLPEAFVNLLALLGWTDGSESEIFSLGQLVEKFSIDRVHKGGAKFNFEKAKWFNHEWIKKSNIRRLMPDVKLILESAGIAIVDEIKLEKIISMVKDRCTFLNDFTEQAAFFYQPPPLYDLQAVKGKWDDKKIIFFNQFISLIKDLEWNASTIEEVFKRCSSEMAIKPGELLLPLRIMLVGGKFGPPVFEIASILGKSETVNRMLKAIITFNTQLNFSEI